MDNNKYPTLEPENHQPEDFPVIPEQMEPLEDVPVIEELTFSQEPQKSEDVSVVIPDAEIPEEPCIAEIPFPEEQDAEEADGPEPMEASEETVTDSDDDILLTEVPAAHQEPQNPPDTEPITEVSEWEEDFSEFLAAQTIPEAKDPQEPAPETADQEYRDDPQDFDDLMKEPAPKPQSAPNPKLIGTTKGRPKRKTGEGH